VNIEFPTFAGEAIDIYLPQIKESVKAR